MSKTYLEILYCPAHRFHAVAIGAKDSGTRLTPSKCCGSWKTVQRWPVDPTKLVKYILAESQRGYGGKDVGNG